MSRPVGLDRIAGHQPALENLEAALRGDRLHHALLFEGPRGVGKSTLATALAVRMLCDTPRGLAACGRCPSCERFGAGGVAVDLHRVIPNERGNVVIGDPGTPGTVRWLETQLRRRPSRGQVRVGQIEDADRMSSGAKNALLKLLEEPPAGAYLFLVSERPEQLLPTVLSRCLRFRMSPLRPNEVEAVLARALPELSPPERALLAAAADGAPGRALAMEPRLLAEHAETVEALDLRVAPDQPEAAGVAIAEAEQRATGNRDEVRAQLVLLFDTWARWSRDQALLAAGTDRSLSYPHRRAELERRARARGLAEVLHRTDALLEARRQLDLPTNPNLRMVTEQALLTLAGIVPLRRVRPLQANLASR